MSEDDFECFASTGVNAPETMFPIRRYPSLEIVPTEIRFLSTQRQISRINSGLEIYPSGQFEQARNCTFSGLPRWPIPK